LREAPFGELLKSVGRKLPFLVDRPFCAVTLTQPTLHGIPDLTQKGGVFRGIR